MVGIHGRLMMSISNQFTSPLNFEIGVVRPDARSCFAADVQTLVAGEDECFG